MGATSLDRRNKDQFVFEIQFKKNSPVADTLANRATHSLEEFNIAEKGILAHFTEGAIDGMPLLRRHSAQLPLGATSDRQAPFHFANFQASQIFPALCPVGRCLPPLRLQAQDLLPSAK